MSDNELLPENLTTILVVDDEVEIRNLTSEALDDFDYQVLLAASGEEALSLYGDRARVIDMVILDLNMPGMGGYQCLRELLVLDPGVRVLVASGYSSPGQHAEVMAEGAAGFIGKPYLLSELLAKIREILSMNRRTVIPEISNRQASL
jgi:DNA-binding NtrC family response regulator